MKKRYLVTAAGTLGAGAAVARYLLKNKENSINENVSTLDEAGIPDQIERTDLAQIENAKMVSEGSQYGVNYYNEVKSNNVDFENVHIEV